MNLQLLEDYALENGYNPKELIDDYLSANDEDKIELMSHVMQVGGESQEPDIMQVIQAYAQQAGISAEEIVAQLQEMPEEEQQAALQQMMQEVQPQEQEEMAQHGYDERSILGYSDGSPYKYNTSNLIQSNNITMANTGIDLIGISNTGDTKYMPAYSGDYEFDGEEVLEIPYAQKGKALQKGLDLYSKHKMPLVYGAAASSPGMILNNKGEDDSMFEDFVEIFDPTGVSSYDDVYREYKRYKAGQSKWYNLGLEVAGALPLIGKAGKGLKAISKLAKGIDFGADAAQVVSILGTDYNKTGPEPTYFEKLLKKSPEIKELITLRENLKAGYKPSNPARMQYLENKFGNTLTDAQKQHNRITKKANTVEPAKPSKFSKEELVEYNKLLREEKKVNAQKTKLLNDEKELNKLIDEEEFNKLLKEEERLNKAKKQLEKSKSVKFSSPEEIGPKKYYGTKVNTPTPVKFKGDQPLADLSNYGTRSATSEQVLRNAALEKYDEVNMDGYTKPGVKDYTKSAKSAGKVVYNKLPGKGKLGKIATVAGGAYGAYKIGEEIIKDIYGNFIEPTQSAKSKNMVYKLANGRTIHSNPDGTFVDENNKPFVKLKDGRFAPQSGSNVPTTTTLSQPTISSGGNKPQGSGKGKSSPLPVKPVTPVVTEPIKRTFDGVDIQPLQSRQIAYDVPTVMDKRLDNLGDDIGKNKIPYSPNNTGLTGNPVYKFKTSNPLGNIINNIKVGKAFEKNALPYMNRVDMSNPEALYIDNREGIQQISNSYDDVMQNVNVNSVTGQSVASNIFAKKEQALADYVNKINTANRNISVENRNQRAKTVTALNDYNNRAKSTYYTDYLQGEATKDENINNILSDVDTLNREDIQVENAYNQLLSFNDNVSDESNLLDKLLGRRKLKFDRTKANQQLLDRSTTA